MADNSVLNPGTGGDTSRSVQKGGAAGPKSQAIIIDRGGAGAEDLSPLDGTDITTPTAMPAGGVGIRGWLSAIWTKLNGTLASRITDGTNAVSIKIGAVAPTAADNALVVALSPNAVGLVVGPIGVGGTSTAAPVTIGGVDAGNVVRHYAPVAKGIQAAFALPTQNLKDSGRARVSVTFQAVAPAVADTLLTLVKVTNGAVAAGATSIGVAAGKTLRISSITLSIKANAAAAAFATLTFRQNPAGPTALTSISEMRVDVGNTAATIGASDKVEVIFPDGMEFTGAQTFGCSLAAQAITNIMSISINGFEY